MATATKNPLSTNQQRFAYEVARGTGLDWRVVEAWVLAENGPDGNPLNIGPGRNYGSVDKAANATISLLHTSIYSAVLKSGKGSADQQLAAITSSPWDAGHYAGAGGSTPGTLLRGTYARLSGSPAPTISGSHSQAFPGAKYVAGAADAAAGDTQLASSETGLSGWAGQLTGWVENKAAYGLAYVLLGGMAVALILIGLSRASGITPRSVLAARAGAGGGIPY
jgi:hypothetical protein